MKRVLVLAALALLVPSTAAPQALPNMASVRVRYNTQKATVQPQGELKAMIDELDQQIAAASKLGQVGELRRLFAKGTTLLAGREWTDALDFANSLAIRSDRVVVDSAHPYVVRLEQIRGDDAVCALVHEVERIRAHVSPNPPMKISRRLSGGGRTARKLLRPRRRPRLRRVTRRACPHGLLSGSSRGRVGPP
jgi:hypothetical protein